MSARLVPLPPLPLNSAFGVTLTRDTTAGAISGSDTLRFYIDLVGGGTSGRKILDQTSATISNGGYTVAFSKTSAWVAANMSDGTYQCLLFVNGTYDCGCTFDAYTAPGGEANPTTDTAST